MNGDGVLGVVTQIGGHDPLNSFRRASVATVGIHAREHSYGGSPGSRSRHLESVSRTSWDVHQRPDLLAGRSAMSADVH